MLIVEEDQTRPKASPAFSKYGAPSYVREALPVLTRTAVPADNSCLFTSVYYVVEGGVLNPACAPEMRRLIAQIVASDPVLYSEAILYKPGSNPVTPAISIAPVQWIDVEIPFLFS